MIPPAHGPRRYLRPGAFDLVVAHGRRRVRRRQVAAGAGSMAFLAAVGSVAFVPPARHVARTLVSPIIGEPEFEGEEWVRLRLPYTEVADSYDGASCSARPGAVVANGWCATLAATDVAYGGEGTIVYTLCRDTGVPAVTLHWTNFTEIDMTVGRGTTVAWQWSNYHVDPPLAEHEVRFGPTRCRTWTERWTAILGMTPTTKGEYTLTVTVPATNVTGAPEMATTIRIT